MQYVGFSSIIYTLVFRTIIVNPHEVEKNETIAYKPPGWLPVRASEDWRQISVKPAVAATPAAVVLMQ